jgi:hypothetical protein
LICKIDNFRRVRGVEYKPCPHIAPRPIVVRVVSIT